MLPLICRCHLWTSTASNINLPDPSGFWPPIDQHLARAKELSAIGFSPVVLRVTAAKSILPTHFIVSNFCSSLIFASSSKTPAVSFTKFPLNGIEQGAGEAEPLTGTVDCSPGLLGEMLLQLMRQPAKESETKAETVNRLRGFIGFNFVS